MNKEKKQLSLFLIILYLVIFSIFNNYFLAKLKLGIKTKQAKILSLKSSYANDFNKRVQLRQLTEILREKQGKLNVLNSNFIKETQSSYLMKLINKSSKTNGISFNSLEFEKKDEKFIIKIKFSARYKNLINYLRELKSLSKEIYIDKLSVIKTNGTLLDINLNIYTYILKEGD